MFRFYAYRARREGKPIPRYELHRSHWTEARLTLKEERDDWLGRTIRVARLRTDRGSEVFPPLLEAEIIHADEERIILKGVERDERTKADRIQTWVLHATDKNGNRPMTRDSESRAAARPTRLLPP